jgi:hypothetical protein
MISILDGMLIILALVLLCSLIVMVIERKFPDLK